MKRSLIVIIAAVIIGASILSVRNYNASRSKVISSEKKTEENSTTENKTSTKPIEINPNVIKTKAIDFKLKDLEGKELSLSDLKGKKVFLNFWATWCPPCKEEMPEIEKLYQETKDGDLVIVAIEIGEPLSTVKSFIDSNKYNFKVLLDTDNSVATKYNISGIPTSYFIDVNGNITSKSVGAINIEQMKEYIKALDN